MSEKTAMLSSDNTPVYVAAECVDIFIRSGYKFADKQGEVFDQKVEAADKQGEVFDKKPKQQKKKESQKAGEA